MRYFKDECDACKHYRFGVHGYNGVLLCPDCAQEAGYKIDIPASIIAENKRICAAKDNSSIIKKTSENSDNNNL